MEMTLKGKAALVTGGSRGLGRSICLALAEEGADVAINFRREPEKTAELASLLAVRYGVRTVSVKGDITDEGDVRCIFAEAAEELSGLDILVNNSGICPVSMVKDMSLDEWDSVIRTNLTGTFLTCREMVNQLLSSGRKGKIVNIASQAAFNGSRNGKSHYSASKGGVVSFTHSLALEVAGNGINVNAIAPGMMYTGMTAETLDENMDRYRRDIPLGRVAEPDEIAKVVAFLVSDAASYITGATVDASGGIIGR